MRWETETWDPATDSESIAYYLMKAVLHRPGAPEESLEHFAVMRDLVPPLSDGVRISFVGDVMWVGSNWSAFAEPAGALLDGNLRVGNLETPTSPNFPNSREELGAYAFNAPPEMLDGLPLDVLQLNNNHTIDIGDAGVADTLSEVLARGFLATGIDGTARVEVGGLDIALLSYTWGLNVRDAPTSYDLRVVPFGHVGETIDLSRVTEDIATARSTGADLVVVLPHWGFEYEYYADPHFLVLARDIVAAGADMIVGSGPHVAQPIELCTVNGEGAGGVGRCDITTADGRPRTAAIAYSLGNFGTSMETAPCKTGLVLTASVDASGVTGLGWSAAATVPGPEGPEVRPLADLIDDPAFAAESARLDAHLGTGWKR